MAATFLLWLVVLALVGSVQDFSATDYVRRATSLPTLYRGDDPVSDYRNWSVLPLVLARLVGVETVPSFALLQVAVLVVGTATLAGYVARDRGTTTAWLFVAALFSSSAAAYALHFAGSYDQVLVVLLSLAALSRTSPGSLVVGVALGLTHAEIGIVVALGLCALALVGLGPTVRSRLFLLGGVVAARVMLTVWFAAADGGMDRLGFARGYGAGRTIEYLVETWPIVLWSCLLGGWVLVISYLTGSASRLQKLVVVAWVAGTLFLVALTVDASRIAALVTLPMVVVLAGTDARPDEAMRSAERKPPVLRTAMLAACVGILAPLTVSLAGEVYTFNSPFHIGW